MIGLFLITLSFVLYKRKALLMMRALFSKRYLQQLLREGKLLNERINLYSTLLFFFTFPSLVLAYFAVYVLEPKIEIPEPAQFYAILIGGSVVLFFVSQIILRFFTNIFNYQEQRHLYSAMKVLFRYYHALFLTCFIPLVWYTRAPEVVYLVYFSFLILIFLTYFIQFLRNISGITRIHFFIYFCSLEILPCLLLYKLLIIKL